MKWVYRFALLAVAGSALAWGLREEARMNREDAAVRMRYVRECQARGYDGGEFLPAVGRLRCWHIKGVQK